VNPALQNILQYVNIYISGKLWGKLIITFEGGRPVHIEKRETHKLT
jgi:hypothetical protein